MLTDAQKEHFEVFGYLVLRRLFDREEAETIRREAYDVFLEQRHGRPFDGSERQTIKHLFTMRPFLDRVVDDDRILHIACDLLGEDYVLVGTIASASCSTSKSPFTSSRSAPKVGVCASSPAPICHPMSIC